MNMIKPANKAKVTRTAILALSLAAVAGIGTAAAYFTDSEIAHNSFTVGSIDIELAEEEWDIWKTANPDPIVPDQEIPKDPVISNTGDNDAYVFATVTVPTANIVTAGETGARVDAAETQLFHYSVNGNWTLVTSNVRGGGTLSFAGRTGNYGVHTYDSNAGTGSVTYVYAYTGTTSSSMEVLSPGEDTPVLFPAVKFVNAIEGQGLEAETPEITVTAYAIQADFINNGDSAIDGDITAGQTAPATVWGILEQQNTIPTTTPAS